MRNPFDPCSGDHVAAFLGDLKQEWINAQWFSGPALAKALDLMRWPTDLRSWGRGRARDVWAVRGCAPHPPRLVTSDDTRAVVVAGVMPSDGFSVAALDVQRMIEWLGARQDVYQLRDATIMRSMQRGELTWAAAAPVQRCTGALDGWHGSLEPVEHRTWSLGLRCEDVADARKALAATAGASAAGVLEVLVTPWGHVDLAIDGGTPITKRVAAPERGFPVFPGGLSLHVTLPAHAFFGLFSGIYRGRGLATLECWSDPARPHEAVLSVRRKFMFPSAARGSDPTWIDATTIAVATAANGVDVGVKLRWPALRPSVIEEVCAALECCGGTRG